MIPPQHLKFWPYAGDQELEISNLSTRFVHWRRAIIVVLNYVDEMMKVEKQSSKIHRKYKAQLENADSNLGSSSVGVFTCWKDFAAHYSDTQQSLEAQLNKLVLMRLENLKNEINKKIGVFDKDLSRNWRTISKFRTATYNIMQIHENHLLSIEKQNDIASPTVSADPWLMERVLKQKLTAMVDAENSFQMNMKVIVENMSVFDAHVVEELKRIFEEFASIKSKQADSMKNQIIISLNAIVQIDSYRYFASFSETHHLDSPAIWRDERKISDFPMQARKIEILKQGLLYRPSKLGMNLWIPMICVLTSTGFFHAFPNKTSVFLEYYQTKSSNRLNSIQEDESQFLPDSTNSEISISLSQPRVVVQSVLKKPQVLEFVINQRKQSFFGKTVDFTTRFEFKALSEIDMIEWLGILQHEIKHRFPSGPPAPIFKTTQEIESDVGNIISDLTLKRAKSLGADGEARSALKLNHQALKKSGTL